MTSSTQMFLVMYLYRVHLNGVAQNQNAANNVQACRASSIGSEVEKTYFRTSDKSGKGMVEIRFAISGASSVSDYRRLMKPLRGQNVSPPLSSHLCLMFWSLFNTKAVSLLVKTTLVFLISSLYLNRPQRFKPETRAFLRLMLTKLRFFFPVFSV